MDKIQYTETFHFARKTSTDVKSSFYQHGSKAHDNEQQ